MATLTLNSVKTCKPVNSVQACPDSQLVHWCCLILDCYSNVFQSLIISTNYSIHFRYLSCAINSNGVCSSFKYNHLPHLPVVADRHSLEIIKYSNNGQIRLLVAHTQSQMFHSFSTLIQPTHSRSTPSALIFEINLGTPKTDIWARWWNSSAGCQMLRLDI